MSKTPRTVSQLRWSEADNDTYAGWGAWLVVIGVLLEIGIAFVFPSGKSPIEDWAPIVADALIAGGVIAEIHFGRVSSNASKELRSLAELATAEAKERVAQAELETQRLKVQFAGRHFTLEQRNDLTAAIRDKAASLDVLVEFQRSDAEAFLYGFELVNIFKSAGVEKRRFVANEYLSGMVFGLWITESPELNGYIGDAFRNAGIASGIAGTKDLSAHLSRNEVAPNLYIFIGPKPPVPAETEVDETP